jgi:uncharacterized protein
MTKTAALVRRGKASSGSLIDQVGGRIVLLCALAMAAIVLSFGMAFAEPNYPQIAGRITDNANLITAADRAAIEQELADLEAKSTDQIAVVTVPSLDGYPIEDYAIGLARKWGIGQAGKDNGIVVLVAPNERKVRIEVGRRLEPLMTDTMSKLIVENAILSKFRRGDFSGGVRDGVRDIKAVLLGDADEVKQRSRRDVPIGQQYEGLITLAVFLGIFALVMYLNARAMRQQREFEQNLTPEQRRQLERRRRRRQFDSGPVIIIPGGSGGWSGGGMGGGWSGGGGDFGGGGASGDW